MAEPPDFVFYLGDFGFRDFEIPESVRECIEQNLVVHDYIGGARTIDAMGAHRKSFSWTGALTFDNCEWRRDLLEGILIDGLPLQLTYGSRIYDVLVQRLEFDFKRYWHIPYRIDVEIVKDLSDPQGTIADEAIDTQLREEMEAASYGMSLFQDPTLAGMVNAANLQVRVFSETQATLNAISDLSQVVINAQAYSSNLIPSLDEVLVTVASAGLFAAAADPLLMTGEAAALVAAAVAVPAALEVTARLGQAARDLSDVEG
jgi:hypothetical protein